MCAPVLHGLAQTIHHGCEISVLCTKHQASLCLLHSLHSGSVQSAGTGTLLLYLVKHCGIRRNLGLSAQAGRMYSMALLIHFIEPIRCRQGKFAAS